MEITEQGIEKHKCSFSMQNIVFFDDFVKKTLFLTRKHVFLLKIFILYVFFNVFMVFLMNLQI